MVENFETMTNGTPYVQGYGSEDGDQVEPKITTKIHKATHRLLPEKDKIALITWANFSDTPTHNSSSLEVQATNYDCSKLPCSWQGKVKDIRYRINY